MPGSGAATWVDPASWSCLRGLEPPQDCAPVPGAVNGEAAGDDLVAAAVADQHGRGSVALSENIVSGRNAIVRS